MTLATSGPTLLVPLAHFDRASSCWRTSQGMFPSDWPTSSETCPRWGMTRSGELFALPTPARLISGSESSSSQLPTPTADDRRNAYGTGASRDYQSLANTAVTELLPTPVVNDMGRGKTVEAWDEWTERLQAKHSNGNGHGKSLEIETLRLLPTPLAHDSRGGKTPEQVQAMRDRTGAGVRNLNEVAVNEPTSAHTRPPSSAGSGSPDDPHPTRPSPATLFDLD